MQVWVLLNTSIALKVNRQNILVRVAQVVEFVVSPQTERVQIFPPCPLSLPFSPSPSCQFYSCAFSPCPSPFSLWKERLI